MSKRKGGPARSKYTVEYKLEAVRLGKGGQSVPVTAKILGVPVQTLGNWVRLSPDGHCKFPHPWPPQIPPGRMHRL